MNHPGDSCCTSLTTLLGTAHVLVAIIGVWVYATPENLMVSQVLEQNQIYRAGMTLCLALEWCTQLLFAARFRRVEPCTALVAAFFATVGLSGWLLLSNAYNTAPHFSGVGLFVAGEASLYITLFVLAQRYTPYWERQCDMFIYVDMLATLSLVVTYVAMYFTGNLPGCWAVEHAALICYVATYTFFFNLHPCNPNDVPEPAPGKNHYYEHL